MRYQRLFEERYEGKLRGKKWYRMFCPFHKDNDASLDVDIKQGGMHCWGCGETGNMSKLVMKLERVSKSTAENIISRYIGRVVTSGRLGDDYKKEIVKYIDRVELEKFVPICNLSYLKYLKSRKISLKLALEYNLREGSPIEHGWDNRLVYPIFDIYGNLCSIEGRAIDNNKLRYRKWTGSKATQGIFGIEKIPENEWGNKLFILEGMFDALSIISLGYRAVAMACSEVSKRQFMQLRRVTKYPVVIFDGHKKGTSKARERVEKKVRESFAKKFTEYEIITIPFADTDPNDLWRQGKLRKFIKGVLNAKNRNGKKMVKKA